MELTDRATINTNHAKTLVKSRQMSDTQGAACGIIHMLGKLIAAIDRNTEQLAASSDGVIHELGRVTGN